MAPIAQREIRTAVVARLKEAGLRNSGSRWQVVDVLVNADRPLSLPEVLSSDPELAQSSVYRNLSELVEVGVARRVESTDEHTRFELHESLTSHHHHLVCSSCGRVEDFYVSEEFEAGIGSVIQAARDKGFTIESHRFDLIGFCAACD